MMTNTTIIGGATALPNPETVLASLSDAEQLRCLWRRVGPAVWLSAAGRRALIAQASAQHISNLIGQDTKMKAAPAAAPQIAKRGK